MDIGLQQLAERGVHQSMPRCRKLAFEGRTDDGDTEMPLPATTAGMAGVVMAVIDDIEADGGQCRFEQGPHAHYPTRIQARDVGLGPTFAHGNTLQNGRTSTR